MCVLLIVVLQNQETLRVFFWKSVNNHYHSLVFDFVAFFALGIIFCIILTQNFEFSSER